MRRRVRQCQRRGRVQAPRSAFALAGGRPVWGTSTSWASVPTGYGLDREERARPEWGAIRRLCGYTYLLMAVLEAGRYAAQGSAPACRASARCCCGMGDAGSMAGYPRDRVPNKGHGVPSRHCRPAGRAACVASSLPLRRKSCAVALPKARALPAPHRRADRPGAPALPSPADRRRTPCD